MIHVQSLDYLNAKIVNLIIQLNTLMDYPINEHEILLAQQKVIYFSNLQKQLREYLQAVPIAEGITNEKK